MEKIIIAFRSFFWKLSKTEDVYILKERKTAMVIYAIICLPLFGLTGLLMFICEKLEYLVDIKGSKITVTKPLDKKQEKLIKNYLLQD